jgi:hypothetical protein
MCGKFDPGSYIRCVLGFGIKTGYDNGTPISRMLIIGGAVVYLMLYSVFKKLGREDNELMKTNLMLNGVGGNPMEARVVISMELTVGSKSLTIAFFSLYCSSRHHGRLAAWGHPVPVGEGSYRLRLS